MTITGNNQQEELFVTIREVGGGGSGGASDKMVSVAKKIDPLYLALLYQRNHDYEKCVGVCTDLLDKNPYDEAVWSLKTRAMTAQVLCLIVNVIRAKHGMFFQVMVDDIEGDEEGIVDMVLDDNAINQVPRPGTSLRTALVTSGGQSKAIRPTTQSGKLFRFRQKDLSARKFVPMNFSCL